MQWSDPYPFPAVSASYTMAPDSNPYRETTTIEGRVDGCGNEPYDSGCIGRVAMGLEQFSYPIVRCVVKILSGAIVHK